MAVLSPDRERRGPVAAASEPSARGQNPPDDLASCTLKATEPSVAQARAFTTMQLAAWDIDNEIVDAARLIVSEFVTNTVQHSGSAKLYLELIRCGSQLRIEVTDMGRWQASESPAQTVTRPRTAGGSGWWRRWRRSAGFTERPSAPARGPCCKIPPKTRPKTQQRSSSPDAARKMTSAA